jgi:glycosyltransferase involved in cell wall biosynthesis
MTTVTVVMPTHNRRHLLRAALRTVLDQRDVEVDVVVVDEGSVDGTAAAVARLDDPRVRLLRHVVPRGLPAARNAGLAVARGTWTAFCDDDDLWAPDKLARQLRATQRSRAVWCCTGVVQVDPDLRVVGWERAPSTGIDRRLLGRRNAVPGGGSGVLVRTDVVRAAGGFDESLRAAEDWDLWIRLAAIGPPAVVDEPLVAYRIWSSTMSRDVSRMDQAVEAVLGRSGTEGGDRERARYRIKQLLRNGERAAAAHALLELAMQPDVGRPSDLPKAVAALLAPRWYLHVGERRSSRAVPGAWRHDAQRWLAPLREPATAR